MKTICDPYQHMLYESDIFKQAHVLQEFISRISNSVAVSFNVRTLAMPLPSHSSIMLYRVTKRNGESDCDHNEYVRQSPLL